MIGAASYFPVHCIGCQINRDVVVGIGISFKVGNEHFFDTGQRWVSRVTSVINSSTCNGNVEGIGSRAACQRIACGQGCRAGNCVGSKRQRADKGVGARCARQCGAGVSTGSERTCEATPESE